MAAADALRVAQRRGREFLLLHRLFRSHPTGNIIKSDFTRFVFPPRWPYDILRALDPYKGKTYFPLERLGMPSRWNTLRALRVLKWWNQGKPDRGYVGG